jgi:hypothetical protein
MQRRLVLPLAVLLTCAALTLVAGRVKKRSAATVSVSVSSLRMPLDTPRPLELLQAVRLQSIVLANFQEVAPTAGTITETTRGGASYDSIHVARPFGNVRLEDVSIRSVSSTVPCEMTMSATGAQSLKVTFSCGTQIRLAVGRSTVGACDDCRGVSGDAAGAHSVQRFRIQSDGRLGDEIVARGTRIPSVLGLELASANEIETRSFAIDRMTFEELRDGKLTSTVLGGTVTFPDFVDRKIDLNRNDVIRFEDVSELRLRSLELGDALALTITGNFAKLDIDSAGTRTNRAPSWLEWSHEKQPAALYIGGVIWLVGLVWNLLKEYDTLRGN